MSLDSETIRRLAECFGRRSCCRCGRPAERLANSRYYCGSHFPRHRVARVEPSRKVYKVALAGSAGSA
jgi:hypothetical protein